MGSGRTNLLLRHDMIKRGRESWRRTRARTHTHKDDGSDWEGFPPCASHCCLRERALCQHSHSLSTAIWMTKNTHTHTQSVCVCDASVGPILLTRDMRSALLTQPLHILPIGPKSKREPNQTRCQRTVRFRVCKSVFASPHQKTASSTERHGGQTRTESRTQGKDVRVVLRHLCISPIPPPPPALG